MTRLPNHLALSLATKGHAYSDPMTRGYIIAVNVYLLGDGEPPVPPIPGPDVSAGGFGLPPDYYAEVKKKLRPDEKIKEIKLRLVRDKKVKDFDIQVELIKTKLTAELIENNLLSDKGFKISIDEVDI